MLSVGFSVSWLHLFHSRYHFLVKKCVFVTKILGIFQLSYFSVPTLDIHRHDSVWTCLSVSVTFVTVDCILGEKVGFWHKTSTFFKFHISLISMKTNTEFIYAMYLYHVRVLFSWLGALFVKNLAFHRKTLTFFNFLNYWISVISFAAHPKRYVWFQYIQIALILGLWDSQKSSDFASSQSTFQSMPPPPLEKSWICLCVYNNVYRDFNITIFSLISTHDLIILTLISGQLNWMDWALKYVRIVWDWV